MSSGWLSRRQLLPREHGYCAKGAGVPGLQDLDAALRFSIFCHDSQAVIRLDGDLDAVSQPSAWLAVELTAATHAKLTVDCRGLDFVDVAGFRFLLSVREQARASGGDLIADGSLAQLHWLSQVIDHPSPSSLRDLEDSGTRCPHIRDAASTQRAAVNAALRISGASMGNLQVLDAPTGELRIVAQQGFQQPFLDYFATVGETTTACGRALSLGVPVWVDDVANSSIFGDPARQMIIDAGSRAVASLPVRAPGDQIVAMISVHLDRPVQHRRWPQLQLRQLAMVAGLLVSPASSADAAGPGRCPAESLSN